MLGWLYRWQERRITRAWAAEIAGDREYLEQYFDYEDVGDGVTVMTPKRDSVEDVARVQSALTTLDGTATGRVSALSGLSGEEINEPGGIGEEGGAS